MGTADYVVDQGGCVCPDLGPYLLGVDSVSYTLRIGDVGDDTSHWVGLGKILPQGCPHADGDETSESTGRSMGISPAGGRDGVGGIERCGYLHLPLK